MKDTVIKGDGTSRTLKAPASMPETFEEWRSQLLAGNATMDISLNSDGCTVVGTPLNKKNLLSNTTKSVLGLSEDAVPDDAFVAVNGKFSTIDKVGDIKTTIRTDLGDKWLLCNGETFDPVAYPDLAKATPGMLSLWDRARYASYYGIDSLIEAGGYQVAVTREPNGSNYHPAILYSTDNFRTYTAYKIGNGSEKSYLSTAVTGCILRYIDGTFVLGFTVSGQYSYGIIQIATTTDITNSVWTVKASAQIGVNKVLDIWKENGTYYVAAAGSESATSSEVSRPMLLQCADITNPSWSVRVLDTTSNTRPKRFVRANGKYAFFRYNDTTYRSVTYASSLSGSWSTVLYTVATTGGATFYGVGFAHVKYYEKEKVWGYFGYCNNKLSFVYTNDLSATSWNIVTSTSISCSDSQFSPLYLVWTRDRYVGMSYKNDHIYTAQSILDPSTWKMYARTELVPSGILPSALYNGTTEGDAEAIIVDNNTIVFPWSSNNSSLYPILLLLPIYALPKISETGAYAYIKALEG